MNGKQTLYIDQYGRPYWAKTLKELKSQLRGKPSKLYVDDKEGKTYHCGYAIGELWLTAYAPVMIPQ